MSVQEPAVDNVTEQLPAPELSVAVHVTVVEESFAVTMTEPDGEMPLPVALTPTLTGAPTVEGFGKFEVIVVVLVALLTVRVELVLLVTLEKLPSLV